MEEGWLPRESFGADGSSRTARGPRNGFWPDNEQVTHHLSCLLETVISNSLPFFPLLSYSFSSFLHGPYLPFLSASFSFHLSPPHHFPLDVWTLPFLRSLFSAWCLSNLGIQIPHYHRLDFRAWPAEHQSANIFSSSTIDKTCSAHKTQILISYSFHILSSRLPGCLPV